MAGKLWTMGRSGHGLLKEWTDDKVEVADAARLFGELQAEGKMVCRMPDAAGNDGEVIKSFDPDAEMLVVNPLQGG